MRSRLSQLTRYIKITYSLPFLRFSSFSYPALSAFFPSCAFPSLLLLSFPPFSCFFFFYSFLTRRLDGNIGSFYCCKKSSWIERLALWGRRPTSFWSWADRSHRPTESAAVLQFIIQIIFYFIIFNRDFLPLTSRRPLKKRYDRENGVCMTFFLGRNFVFCLLCTQKPFLKPKNICQKPRFFQLCT